mgnify:FL=1
MCKNSKKLLLITGLMLVCLSLPSLQLQSATLYTTVPESEQTIVMSKPQYERLKQIIRELQTELNQQEQKLTLLQQNSAEASSELIKAQKELNEQKNELEKTRELLKSAKMDLNEAENSLAKQKTSLMQLTSQIKQMEHKQTVLRRQRDVWALAACVVLGCGLSK